MIVEYPNQVEVLGAGKMRALADIVFLSPSNEASVQIDRRGLKIHEARFHPSEVNDLVPHLNQDLLVGIVESHSPAAYSKF